MKSENLGRASFQMEQFTFNDIEREADAIISSARDQASQVLKQANKDAELIRQDAQREGFEGGLAAGQQEGQQLGKQEALKQSLQAFNKSTEGLQKALGQLFSSLTNERGRLVAELKTELLKLSLTIAGRVVKRVIDCDHDTAIRNLEQAIALVDGASQVEVQLHPDDVASCEEFAKSILASAKQTPMLKVCASEVVTRGGCVLHSNYGMVDATIESQISRLAEVIVPDADNRDAGLDQRR